MKKYIAQTIIILLLPVSRLFAQETAGSYFTSFDTTKIYYEVKGTGSPVILISPEFISGWPSTRSARAPALIFR